jgi:hypothetical protein
LQSGPAFLLTAPLEKDLELPNMPPLASADPDSHALSLVRFVTTRCRHFVTGR